MGWGGLQGGRHYVESSGSDLMVFFSVLLGARCDVPFSEDEDKDKVEAVSFKFPAPHASLSKAFNPQPRLTSHTCCWCFGLLRVVVVVTVVVVMALQFVGELLAQREVTFLHGLTDNPQVDWPLICRTNREKTEEEWNEAHQ